MSPPLQQQAQMQQQHISPIKSRSTQLPTSPTHMAAMRGATHQRHQASFDFSNTGGNDVQMYMNRQQFLYPTPPQEQAHNNSFLSPSPDSPDQWSSGASPQSHSDWSEGIHSPPSVMNGGGGHFQHQPQHHQQLSQHQMINQQTTDAVII